jgi:O-antigen/teichoic acid export membrane protein
VQAALVPSLAAQLAHHRYSEFRTDLRRLVAVIVALTAVAIAVLAGAGPQLLHLFFGPNYDLGRGDLVLLGAATGAYMVAIACGNALLALQRFNWAAFGWVFGAAGFIVVLLLPLTLFQRVEYSYFAGGVVSAVAFGWLVRTGVARAAASSRPSANAGEAVGS